MKYYRVLLLGLLLVPMVVGCSDKQKEADRMEQEMRQMEAEADTGAVPGDTVVDTMAEPGDVYAIPEEGVTEPAMPGRPAGSGYAVQVASCEDEQYASYLVELYTERGYQPYVTVYTEGGQRFHRVRIGLFESLSEAQQLKMELADMYSIEAWIDRE